MKFSFKKFLPNSMQETRWGDLITVWQSIYDDIKSGKIDIILDKNQIEKATQAELLDLGKKFGFEFTQLSGYTSTLDFLKKEVYTIPVRLVSKTALPSYKEIGIPFNLNSTAYPVAANTIVGIMVVDEGGNILDIKSLKYLDDTFNGSTTTTDALNFPNLDASDYAYDYTRRLIFSYLHNTVENENEFLSLNTLKVLNKDVTLNSKLTDRCIFEPYLETNLFPNGKLYVKEWKDYNGDVKAYQSSVMIGDLNNLYKIRFGNGNHYIEDSTITTLRNKIKASYLFDTSNVTLDSSMNGNNLNITNFYDECDFYWNGAITHLTNSSNKLYSKGAYYLSTSSISTSDAYMFDGLYNASNWTIEARIKLNTGLTSAGSLLWATSASGVGFKIDFMNGDTNAVLTFYVSSTGSSYNIQAGSYGSDYMTLDQYHHIALTFDGSIYRLYLDGKLQVSASSALKMIRLNQLNFIGQAGYLDEFRISKNVRYTGSTFTLPTALLTKDSDVLSLFRWSGVVPSEADIDLNYNFEGTLTDVIKDNGKRKAHGTPNNILSGLGVTGNCAVFDGSSSYIQSSTGLALTNILANRFTIMTRLYIDSAGDANAPIITFNNNNDGARIEVNSNNGNITFIDTNHGTPLINTGTILATSVAKDTFITLMLIADSTNLYCYINNVLTSTTTLTGNLQADASLILGKKTLTSGPWFRGKMDSFWIIDRDLTSDERTSLYNSDNFTTPKPYGPDFIFPNAILATFPKPYDLSYINSWAINIKYKFNTVTVSSGKIFQFGTHYLIENGSAARFYINDGTIKGTIDIPGVGDGKWHSLTLSYDSSTNLITTVSDGISLGTTSVPSYIWSNPTNFNIGSTSNYPGFRGSIDALCIFNNTLSVSEMQRLQTSVDISKLTYVADVKSFLFEKIISTECDSLTSSYGPIFRTKMTDTTYPAISEIAGFDASGNYIFYTHFPTIQWDDKMLSNIKLHFINASWGESAGVTESVLVGFPETKRKNELFLTNQILSNTRSNKLFDGLNQSFYKDTSYTDPYISAQYGRVYSNDMGYDIIGKIARNKFSDAKNYINTVINIMKDEDTKGFNGVLHMSYNTITDTYVDPRGKLTGVLNVLRAILWYIYATKDFTHIDYIKTKLDWLLTQQISGGAKDGLFMSGLANTALPSGDVNFGYQTYTGDPNTQMSYSYTEDNALALIVLKWACKITKDDKDLTKYNNYLAAYNKIVANFSKFWSTDHYIAGIDELGVSNTGMNIGANLWGFFTQFNPKDKSNRVALYDFLNYIYTNYVITSNGYKGCKQYNNSYSDEYVLPNSNFDTTINTFYTLMFIYALMSYTLLEDGLTQASTDRIVEIFNKYNELAANLINLRDNSNESGLGIPLSSNNVTGVLTKAESTLVSNAFILLWRSLEVGNNLLPTCFGMYV